MDMVLGLAGINESDCILAALLAKSLLIAVIDPSQIVNAFIEVDLGAILTDTIHGGFGGDVQKNCQVCPQHLGGLRIQGINPFQGRFLAVVSIGGEYVAVAKDHLPLGQEAFHAIFRVLDMVEPVGGKQGGDGIFIGFLLAGQDPA